MACEAGVLPAEHLDQCETCVKKQAGVATIRKNAVHCRNVEADSFKMENERAETETGDTCIGAGVTWQCTCVKCKPMSTDLAESSVRLGYNTTAGSLLMRGCQRLGLHHQSARAPCLNECQCQFSEDESSACVPVHHPPTAGCHKPDARQRRHYF